jgi:hypothetical protein
MSTPAQDALSAAFVAAGHSTQGAEALASGVATTALVDDKGATDPEKVAAVVELHSRVTVTPRDYGGGTRRELELSLSPGAEEAQRRFGPKPPLVAPEHHGPAITSGSGGAAAALARFGRTAPSTQKAATTWRGRAAGRGAAGAAEAAKRFGTPEADE